MPATPTTQWVAQKAAEEAAARAAAEKAARDAAAAAAAAAATPAAAAAVAVAARGGGGGDYVQPGVRPRLQLLRRPLGRHRTAAWTSPPRSGRRSTRPTSGVVKRAGAGHRLRPGRLHPRRRRRGHRLRPRQPVLRLRRRAGARPASRSPRSATAASRPARTCTSRCTPAAQLYSNQINPVPWLNARGVVPRRLRRLARPAGPRSSCGPPLRG